MQYFILISGMILALSATASGETYVVNPEGTGDFPTIQAAIDVCIDGDIIELTDGTFHGEGNRDIDYLGKAITIRSQSGNPEACVVNCMYAGRGFVFQSGEDSTSVLEGVTIVYGYIPGGNGGGAYCSQSSPTVAACVFLDNRAYDGGGMYCIGNCSPGLRDCTFIENNALASGGGVYSDGASPTLIRCTFSGNWANGDGGGMWWNNCTFGILRDCDFRANSATSGGGMGFSWASNLTLTNCTFSGNSATAYGGGMLCLRGSAQTFTRCTFYENDAAFGGAISFYNCSPTVGNCTLAGNECINSGGGMYLENNSLPRIGNAIIAFCTGEAVYCIDISMPTLTCCDAYGNAGGDWVGCIASQYGIVGNISEDPLFCDPGNADFHLHEDSPCAPFTPQNPGCDLIGAWPVGCGPPCSLAVGHPNGGESFCVGEEVGITWEAIGACGSSVRIELLREGQVCATIADSTDNDGTYVWLAEQCDANTDGYTVRVTDLESGESDDSDAQFVINPPCSITVTAPNGGETFVIGDEVLITWDVSACCGTTARIELLHQGAVCMMIAASAENDGTYLWTAQQCDSQTDDYQIRVMDLETGAGDESDGTFSIIPGCSITVTHPNGGELFCAEDEITIGWDYCDSCGTAARIDLLLEGEACLAIADATANDGSYTWIAEQCDSYADGYKVRVTDLETGAFDESNASFSIHPAYRILSITDVGNDQGRNVRVRWQRTWHDHPGTDTTIAFYELWRRVDEYLLERAGHETQAPGSGFDYPPGEWDFVKSVPAHCEEIYSTICETLCDSTIVGGMCWSVFFVRACTPEPEVFFDTAPDSGYSVDNLAPGPPENLRFAGPDLLAWDASAEEDFDYFTVYGSEVDSLDESAELIGYTSGTSMNVAGHPHAYYHVTATDFSGNEGEGTTIGAAAAVPAAELPTAFALHQSRPNPGRPGTVICFDLPKETDVALKVFDPTGRVVVTLEDGHLGPGRHSLRWGGVTAAGEAVLTGVYFYRLETPDFSETRKLLIAR